MKTANSPDGIPKIIISENFTATTKKVMAHKAANRINPLIPSRYRTKNKDKYTSAEPVSFCANIRHIGMIIISKDLNKL